MRPWADIVDTCSHGVDACDLSTANREYNGGVVPNSVIKKASAVEHAHKASNNECKVSPDFVTVLGKSDAFELSSGQSRFEWAPEPPVLCSGACGRYL